MERKKRIVEQKPTLTEEDELTAIIEKNQAQKKVMQKIIDQINIKRDYSEKGKEHK